MSIPLMPIKIQQVTTVYGDECWIVCSERHSRLRMVTPSCRPRWLKRPTRHAEGEAAWLHRDNVKAWGKVKTVTPPYWFSGARPAIRELDGSIILNP